MKGKFIKKLTAYALTAAMVMSTPMTAFASEFADNFWVSDGVTENDPTSTGTGTVSSTNTDTTVLNTALDYSADITGIVIKEQGKTGDAAGIVINLEDKQPQTTLVAEVKYTKDPSAEEKAEINKRITWRSSDLTIVRPAARYTDRSVCPVNAYKGGFANITAEIDVDGDGAADFLARVRVMVKKAPTAVYLNLPNNNTLYAGHTYNLQDYVTFNDDAFDAVTFDLKYTTTDAKKLKAEQKLVTFGTDGTLVLGKNIKDKINVTLEAYTTKADGTKDVTSGVVNVTLDPGTPVTGLKFEGTSKKPAYDIAKNYTKQGDDYIYEKKDDESIKVTVVTKGGTTTDDITWTSSDSKIVRITSTPTKTVDEIYDEITFEGLSVGKAVVTATATSGKSAKVNVTVTATLLKIESAEVEGGTTYTGKVTPIVIKRIPAQNTDKLNVNIPKTIKVVKGKAGINPTITPVVDLTKAKVTNGVAEITGVTVSPANKKSTVKEATVPAFTVEQSDVKIDKVVSAADTAKDITADKATKTVKMNANRTVFYFATIKDGDYKKPGTLEEALETVSWASSKETVAKIEGNGKINVVGEGSANITVSSIYGVEKNGKTTYKQIKKVFTIKSTPKCEKIEFKSNLVTFKEGGKQAVINVKQQLPKKAADDITWYYYDDEGSLKPVSGDAKAVNNKKCTIPASMLNSVGKVVTVVARTSNGVEAEAKIVVIPKK